MKSNRIIASLICILSVFFCVSCGGGTDISGYYICDGMDSVYNFTSDGKIIVNDEIDSYSRYEVDGNKIITYIDGAEESKMEFDFEKTEEGFKMGELEYRKMKEYIPENENVEQK